MLKSIIDWSIRNRIMVLIAAVFLGAVGYWAVVNTAVDAIPDLSDVQVIVFAEDPGKSPRLVEDQVTYPLTTTLLSVPGSKTVRGYSFFGYSLVYVIFEDGTDLYWARSRVLETLNSAQKRLPAGVVPTLGPDATGVGWVYQYVLKSPNHSLQELRSLQDWFLKYELSSVPGVSEVASVGGYVKQYQVVVNPDLLRHYQLSLAEVEEAIMRANGDEGGEAIELGESEYMIRALGYLQGTAEIGQIPVRRSRGGAGYSTVYLRDVAQINVGPEMRRGLADLDGEGEVVGGIVVMRTGANAMEVIKGVKKKLASLQASLPPGVEVVPVYDRADLISRAIKTLKDKLLEEIVAVGLVCLVFLLHLRSALVAVVVLPLSVMTAFVVMRWQGLSANIMSLGGIAIAIGAMVDAAVIMIENAHKHLEADQQKPPEQRREHWDLIAQSAREVGPSLFFSLLVITVSFIPVFTLGDQEGRLFSPLAFTKTYAMGAASILAVTLVPVLMGYFVRGRIIPEHRNPINRILEKMYHPVMDWTLHHPKTVLAGAAAILLLTIYPYSKLGSEFMPPLHEGDILYMPTTLPGVGVSQAKELLQQTDRLIKSVPEVKQVFGKAGRAESPTDPAGLDMLETVIQLHPESQWRPGMTYEKIVAELDALVQIPGLTNSWTMPIKTRIDMLSTGIKTPLGLKISGPDLDTLQRLGLELENVLRHIPGTVQAFAERATGGFYLEIHPQREALARYGLDIAQIRSTVRLALAGMPLITLVEGLERYGVSLRYPREMRDTPEKIGKIWVDLPDGGHIPLAQVAEIKLVAGPMTIRSEDSRPNAYVFVDIDHSDLGGYVQQAQPILAQKVQLPTGYSLHWSGQYESMERMHQRLMVVIPLTLLIILLIIYINTGSFVKTGIVLLAVPFSLVGAFWLLYLLDYQLSMAVWVGIIALAGLDAETGVIMLLYLDKAYYGAQKKGKLRTHEDLYKVIEEGAVRRVRPKVMTATVILAGLLPILWSNGAGADVMKRIAAPMVGGVVSSVAMDPLIYSLWRSSGYAGALPRCTAIK